MDLYEANEFLWGKSFVRTRKFICGSSNSCPLMFWHRTDDRVHFACVGALPQWIAYYDPFALHSQLQDR